jgi:hypothetical protein
MRKELCAIQQSERRYSNRWWRRACRADVVSRKPADLPVQVPVKFEMAASIRLRADEVIE